MNIIEQLQEEVDTIQARIAEIQNACCHPDVTPLAGTNPVTFAPEEGGGTCNLCFYTWIAPSLCQQ